MLKEGFVLLFTIYTGNIPDHSTPIFFGNKQACEATLLAIKHKEAQKRKTSVEGGCFDMRDPRIRAYLKEELEIRQSN